MSGARSSQFASALLLTGAAFERGLRLAISPPRVSFSYVRLTVEILEAFDAVVTRNGEAGFSVAPQRLRATSITIEGDHSSASYALAAVAILGGRVRIHGLRAASCQPDARFLNDLSSLGCRVTADGAGTVVVEASGRVPPFSWDMADAPDLVPTAAILALFADGPCVLSGLHHLTLKESDRLAVLHDNLGRLGARSVVEAGALSIVPPPRGRTRAATIAVADDHRIAMAFAVAGLACPGVTIDDADSVAKSYPRFWEDLALLVRTGS
jgi:3-phosphoshikimate 1-carboxyvinyltransferase